MTASQITLAIGALVLVASVVIIFIRGREKARIEQARLTHTLQQKLKRLMMLVSELPPQYTTPDIKALILSEAQATLDELRALDPRPEYEATAAALATFANNLEAGGKIRPIQNAEQAKTIRRLLEILYRFIDKQRQRKRIDAATARKHLEQTAFLMAKTLADVHTNKAKAAADAGKPRVAIHHYHDAIAAMMKIKSNPLAKKHILIYKKRMEELEKQAAEMVRQKLPEKAPQAAKLDEEWNKVLSEDESWKKKQTYD